MFEAIEEEETHIKAKSKTSTNFPITKSDFKSQRIEALKGKTVFVEYPKYSEYDCKYFANQLYNHAYKECNKCHKNRHSSHFYNSYTLLNKKKSLKESGNIFSSDFEKNMSCITQILSYKMFKFILFKISLQI